MNPDIDRFLRDYEQRGADALPDMATLDRYAAEVDADIAALAAADIACGGLLEADRITEARALWLARLVRESIGDAMRHRRFLDTLAERDRAATP